MLKKDCPGYTSWMSMKARCNYPYTPYYQKGVKICDEWNRDFWSFYRDMGPRPDGLTLERIDNTKGYEPGNCKWATRSEQQINRRTPKNNKSGYRGVCFRPSENRWRANISVNGFNREIGTYGSALEAATAYNAAAMELHGEHAHLNVLMLD